MAKRDESCGFTMGMVEIFNDVFYSPLLLYRGVCP